MAPKQYARGNLSKFVHRHESVSKKHKQANDGDHGYFEDLKETVPKPGKTANARQPRSQGMNTVQHRVQNGQANGTEQFNAKGQFYGTDASSIGDSSETPGADAIQAAHAQATDGGANMEDDHVTQLSSSSQRSEGALESQEYEYEDVEMDMRSGLPFGGLSAGAIEKMREMDAAKASRAAGPISGHMVGDSYPSTTTPPESIQDPIEQEPTQVKREDGAITSIPSLQGLGQQQGRATPQRKPAHHSGKLEIRPGQQHPQQIQPPKAPLQRQDAAYQTYELPQVDAGFRYYAPGANPSSSVYAPQNHQRQSNAVANPPRNDILHGAAQVNRASEIERNHSHPPQASTAKGLYEAPPRQLPAREHHIAERLDPTKRVQIEQAPHSYVLPPSTTPYEKAAFANQQPQQEPMSPSEDSVADIDYDGPELYGMEYPMLRGQSFDIDPRREATAFPNMTKNDPLDRKMEKAASFDKALQHALLESLPIDEWEQAGDWFLGKFSSTLKKLKDVRQEKRKAAHVFEQEIEMRHVAVIKKRKVTDDVLGEIKKSGSLVLEGTPKKAPKTK